MLTRISRKKQRLSGSPWRPQATATRGGRYARWLPSAVALVFLVVALTKQLAPVGDTQEITLDGPIVQQTVASDIAFKSEDLEATRRARIEAAALVPDAYTVDTEKVTARLTALSSVVQAIEGQREAVAGLVETTRDKTPVDQPIAPALARAIRTFAERLDDERLASVSSPDSLAVWLTPLIPAEPETQNDGTESALDNPPFEFAYLTLLSDFASTGLSRVLSAGVLKAGETGSDLSKDVNRRILIQRKGATPGNPVSEEEIPFARALNLESCRDALRTEIGKLAQDAKAKAGAQGVDWISLQDAAYDVAQDFLTDTLVFDSSRTTSLRELAELSVEPVMKDIAPTEEIVARGERWTPQTRLDVKTYLAEKQRYEAQRVNVVGAILGNAALAAMVLLALGRALPFLIDDRKTAARDHNLILLVICATIGAGRAASYFDDSGLTVPITAAAVLIAILTNVRLAGMVALMIAALISAQFDHNWRLLIVGATMSVTGVMSIYKVRRRSDMGGACVKATVVGLFAAAGISMTQDTLVTETTLFSMGYIGLNGVMCLFLVPGLLAPLERLFGITTDIQLLEYSDLNNHILSRLAMEVPATYAHSLMLGQLAEAACDAVGANGLMARVCAYYHDIGKLRRPEYFIENQTGANIHDGMSPRLSARAIASHVTEGAEMARELHLPGPIIDAIYEHHGTCLISFFYKEAVAQQKHGGVIESDFRYPGPKPQSRETAILMICDAVESAARTVKNPNEERIGELIDRIIASRSSDHQFDDCELTLKDLNTISEVLTKRIMSVQHRRIVYPGQPAEPKESAPQPAGNVVTLSGGSQS